MTLTNKNAELYGIINVQGSNFKAGNITIKGDSDTSIIGITHKWNAPSFEAGNINIDGTGRGYMVGIENQMNNTMGMKDVTIKLTKKENGGGHTTNGMVVVSNPGANFKANNTTIILDNTNGTDKTTGINVGTNTANIQGDLKLDIKGNANGDVVGVIGKTEVTGKVDAYLSGGKNVTGISGAANIGNNAYMKIDSLGAAYGINAGANDVAVGGSFGLEMTGKNFVAVGIASTKNITINGDTAITIRDTSADVRMAGIMGNTNTGGKVTLGGQRNHIYVQGSSNFAEGIFGGVTFADNSYNNIIVQNTKDSFVQTHGIYDQSDKGFNLGKNAVLQVSASATGTNSGKTGSSEGVFGVLLTNEPTKTESVTQEGSKLQVWVDGPATNEAGLCGTVGIGGSLQAKGDVSVQVTSEGGIGIGARAVDDISTYNGEVIVKTNKGNSLATIGYNGNSEASIVIDPATGKKVQLEGDIKHFTTYGARTALIDVNFKTADSYLTGASIGADATNRTTNLNFSNGSTWNMTGDSITDDLKMDNSTLNMRASSTTGNTYETLTTDTYTSTGSNLIMDTDLASESTGDKLVITGTSSGGANTIQVHDASLAHATEVTGVKNLLLVSGADSSITYTGKSLDAGGLWDVTPTIVNGTNALDVNGNPIGTPDQWYLSKIEKKVNNDTTTYLTDRQVAVYNQWTRINNDSLRKRLGDLRYNEAEAGVWARFVSGKLGGADYSQHYQMYQVGIDKTNGNSTYGFAFDRQQSNQSYTYGGGEGSTNAGSFYYTNQTPSGSYFDTILKYGHISSEYYTTGNYPDKADYTTPAYSLSMEYGKTNNYKDGYFFEPKVQLTYGHINAENYYTDRGTRVEESAIKSLIGKVGFVAGRKINKDSDYYVKAGWFKEFKGDRDVQLFAANGEYLPKSESYNDSWFEIGLGGNVKIAKKTHLYGDIEKSIGADIQKKWQINAGVRWEF